MAKIDEQTLSERKERMRLLLQRHPDGLKESEIAAELNFERRTTNNYLRQLETEGQITREGQLWYALDWQRITLRKFDLEPEQAMVLYLAARLFVKQSDRRNETAETVLQRLAHILGTDAGLGDVLYNAAAELAARPEHADYPDVFRAVARAYLHRKKLHITYQPYHGKPFTTVFSPYLLEPSGIGFATYVIGYSEVSGALRTYKLERIHSASITRESFTIPADFDGLALLRNAWSIYYGEATTTVHLRFHPDVARRVQETNWHPSQELSVDPNGYVHLSFEVADTTDLKPWIRTWGANCEVLAPQILRDELTGEARRLAHLYGWSTETASPDPHARFSDIFGGSA